MNPAGRRYVLALMAAVLAVVLTGSCVSGGRGKAPAGNSDSVKREWQGLAIPSAERLEALKWTGEEAARWYEEQPWIAGANFVPSTAVNMIEMFREKDFDPETIRRELAWASDAGFNCMRVFLPYLLWKEDRDAFLDRFDRYLDISMEQGIRTIPVLFDSVWDPLPAGGEQKEPIPHTHNSRWVQSPGVEALMDRGEYPLLEEYVRSVVTRFGRDDRILFWDLMNEPDNGNIPRYHRLEPRFKAPQVYRLLSLTYLWARECRPGQPLTAGVWINDWSAESTDPFVRLQLDASDIITFHVYADRNETERRIRELLPYGRPLVCTEYMARTMGSTFQKIMPLFHEYRIGAVSWGLVSGKSQTIYPWDSWDRAYGDEPEVWFHDVFREDGSPYDPDEIGLIRKLAQE